MNYTVLIVVKDGWWSDQKEFPTFSAALKHRTKIAQRWNDCETAIRTPNNRVLAFQESLKFKAEMKEENTQ